MTSTDPGSFPRTSAYPDPYTTPRDLPLGRWYLMANGRIYQLDITAVSGTAVTATLSSGDVKDAKWDASTRKLTFFRSLPRLGLVQQFTGYLLAYSDGKDPKWRMAGIFGNDKAKSGWYATQHRI